MPLDDGARLHHMLESARITAKFIRGRRRSDLDDDQMLLFALVRALEIIGEAAGQVSPQGKAMLPNIRWADFVRMRNRLIHAYFRININVVWNTAINDVPVLIAELESFLAANSTTTDKEEGGT